jgi:hypothetical protein
VADAAPSTVGRQTVGTLPHAPTDRYVALDGVVDAFPVPAQTAALIESRLRELTLALPNVSVIHDTGDTGEGGYQEPTSLTPADSDG